jgi:hypothetical protein
MVSRVAIPFLELNRKIKTGKVIILLSREAELLAN